MTVAQSSAIELKSFITFVFFRQCCNDYQSNSLFLMLYLENSSQSIMLVLRFLLEFKFSIFMSYSKLFYDETNSIHDNEHDELDEFDDDFEELTINPRGTATAGTRLAASDKFLM
jgi:hypothetical protein